ncbi:hypothetical protein FVR03_21795 [Pontibacter qinzhouensis]|uniref:YncE family protein n=1 Tax=Pontibacter qinzhouensis TaxID=2603253 RepID=A0A5C8IX99_9BACT|nr:DUF5074 domain-containing protein [Pontibacter qinzhouensis]TXK26423.1 hypothetical protein FVR03_21795 [Pontibacter qinzhouensis]
MKKFTFLRSIFMTTALAAGALALSSCEDKASGPTGTYAENAVLISNEGSFTASNASVSYYNRNTGAVENNIFSKENDPQVLGDVLQSIAVHNDRAYMVMNNSKKVVVANVNTFKAEGEISGLEMPRYFAALNNQKAYVTEWVTYSGNGRIAVVDLNTLTVTKTIEVGVNPEKLVISGGKLYVANIGGSTISVINTATDAVETSIAVTRGPNSLVVDRNNVLWVASSNSKAYNADWTISEELSQPGALAKINTSTNTVTGTFNFTRNAPSPSNLTTNANKDKVLFVYDNKVYQQDIAATTLNATPFINRGASYPARSFNGFGIDPSNGYIYAGKAPNYTSDGWVVRYNTTGAVVDSFRVGIAPNGFVFR